MKLRFLLLAGVLMLSVMLLAETATPPPAPTVVPYPEGYRQWMHVTSVVNLPKKPEAVPHPDDTKMPGSQGLIHHLYANEKALEGYRTGRFPEGAVLIADWFKLEEARSGLVQGPRQSTDVMIRDARYADTGGWGFEKFDRDSHTVRKVGANAVKTCFECHARAGQEREFVFSTLKP